MADETTETEINETTLRHLFDQVNLRANLITDAQRDYEAALYELHKYCKTFELDGQHYQVCERFQKDRGEKVPFLKKLPGHPSTWLGRKTKAGPSLANVPDLADLDTLSEEPTEEPAVTVTAAENGDDLPDFSGLAFEQDSHVVME